MSGSNLPRLLSSLLLFGCTVEPVADDAPQPPSPPPPVELVAAGDSSGWRVATYPIWGLPRDLADAPLTYLNRTGMNVSCALRTDDFSSGRIVVLGSALAFAVAGIADGWAHANSHLYEQLFYGEVFGWGYAAVGYVAGVVAVAGYEYVVVPVQVATLRTGVDGVYWKGDATRCQPRADGGYDEATLIEQARSTCYFPNWQLLARNQSYAVKRVADG